MKKVIYFLVVALALIVILQFIPFISSSHFIVGYVNNSFDGESANDYRITIWNPSNGINDNLTDIMGVNGNSGSSNVFFVDCESLLTPCNIGDELRAQVFNNGSDRITRYVNLTITGSGFDTMPESIINSIPNVTSLIPINFANISQPLLNLSCSVSDLDANLANVSLYGNWTGTFSLNETISSSGSSSLINFTKNISEGKYLWSCLVSDDLSISRFFYTNYTFTLDRTPPNISQASSNFSSSACVSSMLVKVNCSVSDSFTSVESVYIEGINPSNGSNNYTAYIESLSNYAANISVNQIGSWTFNCWSNDSAGNTANRSISEFITINPPQADLIINVSSIIFDNNNTIENQPVVINASVINQGCSPANNFLVGFYVNDPDGSSSIQINSNKTISVSNLSSASVNVTWSAMIGPQNIFVYSDVSNLISEYNETNNKGNNTIHINAWQIFYGNSSVDKILANQNSSNITLWSNETSLDGNIYFTDSESNVNWKSLQALSRNKTNSFSPSDFIDVDTVLNMSNFSDSIMNTFTINGTTPKLLENITIYQKILNNTPMINSTNNTNFRTGILWDTSDDSSNNGEFDIVDKEDLIFFSPINNDMQGLYGRYDYEISIPVRIREANTSDISAVYIYFELN